MVQGLLQSASAQNCNPGAQAAGAVIFGWIGVTSDSAGAASGWALSINNGRVPELRQLPSPWLTHHTCFGSPTWKPGSPGELFDSKAELFPPAPCLLISLSTSHLLPPLLRRLPWSNTAPSQSFDSCARKIDANSLTGSQRVRLLLKRRGWHGPVLRTLITPDLIDVIGWELVFLRCRSFIWFSRVGLCAPSVVHWLQCRELSMLALHLAS
jgi:hypothetical protein